MDLRCGVVYSNFKICRFNRLADRDRCPAKWVILKLEIPIPVIRQFWKKRIAASLEKANVARHDASSV